MPLVGLKKSKKQKRDPSPPYTTRASIEEKDKELKALRDDNTAITEELKREKNQGRILREEFNRLQEDNKKAKDRADGIALSIPAKEADNSKQKLEDELKEANKQLEEKNAIITNKEARNKDLEDEITKANKTLDKERAQRLKSEDEKEKYKREKDATETALGLTKKELEIVKRERHIPRSPTRVHSENDQLVREKEQLEQQLTALKDEHEEAMSNARASVENKRKELKDLTDDNTAITEELKREKNQGRILRTEINRLKADNKKAKDKADGIALSIPAIDADETTQYQYQLREKEEQLEIEEKQRKKVDYSKQKLEDELKEVNKQIEEKNVIITKHAARNKDVYDEITKANITLYKERAQRLKSEEEKEIYKREKDAIDYALGLTKTELEIAKRKSHIQRGPTRLSAATATRDLDGNPNVSDLSDPNRSQKLGKQICQLYDNEWIDASENLVVLGKKEGDIIKTLLDLLTTVYGLCKELADNQLSRIEEDIFLPPLVNQAPASPDTNETEPVKSPTSSYHSMSRDNESNGKVKDTSKRSLSFNRIKEESLPEVPPEVRKGIKEYRKRISKQVTPVIEKLCWLMRVQDPPVSLLWDIPDDRSFNSEVYRAYTKSGTHIEYLVWPTMYLYEGGPILTKGVAQGIYQ